MKNTKVKETTVNDRRIFYVEVGGMHIDRITQYLENVVNKFKQKKNLQ